MVKTMVGQAVLLQPMEFNSGAVIHLQSMENPTLEHVDAPKGGFDPMETPRWSKLLAGPVVLWRGAHTGAGLLAGLVTLWGIHTGEGHS
ncbi:AN1-type zinc finger protein 5-like [Grus japonensis]|uniref:AN1-type zinc finger protein 5-like n=1 Tax=Grus japonensis TaxID=30415 RepID=A0ABC9W2W8_GRUJA